MLSPLLLKLPGIAWKADECVAGGDCSPDDSIESFRDKGDGSACVFWFRLRSAIFEDGGTGSIGIGLMGLLDILTWLLGPKERFSNGFSTASGTATTAGASATGKLDNGNPPWLWLRCGCGFGSGAVSWCTWSSSMEEPKNCRIKPNKRGNWDVNIRWDLLLGLS